MKQQLISIRYDSEQDRLLWGMTKASEDVYVDGEAYRPLQSMLRSAYIDPERIQLKEAKVKLVKGIIEDVDKQLASIQEYRACLIQLLEDIT